MIYDKEHLGHLFSELSIINQIFYSEIPYCMVQNYNGINKTNIPVIFLIAQVLKHYLVKRFHAARILIELVCYHSRA